MPRWVGTALSYIITLLVALFILWLFGVPPFDAKP